MNLLLFLLRVRFLTMFGMTGRVIQSTSFVIQNESPVIQSEAMNLLLSFSK